MAFQIGAGRENAQLARVFEELHRHAHEAELDSRQSSRSLGRARGSAETIGADAKKETDQRQVLMRQLLAAHDIVYTVVSTAMSWSSGGNGGAIEQVDANGSLSSKVLQAFGPLGVLLDGLIRGAEQGAAEGAIAGAFDALADWVIGSLGPVGRLLSAERETLHADASSRLHYLRQALEQGVAETKALAGDALLQENEDRSAASDEHERIAGQLAEAEAAARRRRAKAQVEQTEIERALLEIGSSRALA